MVRVCEKIDLDSATQIRYLITSISSGNIERDIQILSQQGATNLTMIYKESPDAANDILDNYRSKLQGALISASPGTELMACQIDKIIWWLIPPLLLILGTAGNMVSVIVLMRRRLPAHVYLSALALADQGVLLTGLARHWADRLFLPIRFEDMLRATCILSQLAGSCLSYLSAWLTVAVTAERAVAIAFPLSVVVRHGSGRKRESAIVLGITLTCAAFSAHFLVTADLNNAQKAKPTFSNQVNNSLSCEIRSNLNQFSSIWHWIDALLYSYLPFVLIFFLNTIIVVFVRKAKSKRSRITTNVKPRKSTSNTNNSENQTNTAKDNSNKTTSNNLSSNSVNQQNSRQTFQLTFMLIAISVCFLTTTAPIVVIKIISRTQHKYKHSRSPVHHLALYQLLHSAAEMLMYLNHAANFYLYCATGAKFRSELLHLFCQKNCCCNCCGRSNSTPHVNTAAPISQNPQNTNTHLIVCDKSVKNNSDHSMKQTYV